MPPTQTNEIQRLRFLSEPLSEDLLARFADLPLLSRYDVYQRLMDYWAETMQDDVYLLAAKPLPKWTPGVEIIHEDVGDDAELGRDVVLKDSPQIIEDL